ncbi:MAG: biotin synthase BioB [Coriobacteriales bacterium]|jgi:biotin synthase
MTGRLVASDNAGGGCDAIAREIIEGRRLTRADDLAFLLEAPLEHLGSAANEIRRACVGEHVDLCAILAARSGRCSEDCAFCAQSGRHKTDCDVHGMMAVDEIVAVSREIENAEVNRFALVTSGKRMSGKDFKQALEAYRQMRSATRLNLCASMGLLAREQLEQLHDAGVTRYHCNIETSRHFFPQICTTHAFDEKIATIRAAQKAGLEVCSGGIIGMGETREDRVDMALALAELDVRSIPLNVLSAIPGTPLEKLEPLPEDEVLRAAAIFRFINPEAHIRLAGGRSLLSGWGERVFSYGASATITGNMLTTTSSSVEVDRQMLDKLGRDTSPDWK